MRIAVIDRDKCRYKECGYLCAKFCPVQISRGDIFELDGPPKLKEELCIGCGICVKKCPYGAIRIVNLPKEPGDPIHQYGPNSFRLYGLPHPKEGKVVGILGRNGTGKTTALKILSGELKPNLGRYSDPPDWEEIVKKFRGKEIQAYFERLSKGGVKVAVKPQNIEQIPYVFQGKKVRDLLARLGDYETVSKILQIEHLLDREVENLSGGELQKIAIAATLMKKADLYFFDEPSSYLDVGQRFLVAKVIRNAPGMKMVVEHDLAVLDFIADIVFIVYGEPGAYGIFSSEKTVKNGINEFLDGYLRAENVKIRDFALSFERKTVSERKEVVLFEYPELEKTLGDFRLKIQGGDVREGEVIGILGPNGIGKTTFVRMLAGELEPDNTDLELELKISYKPQYLYRRFHGLAASLFEGIDELGEEVAHVFRVSKLLDRDLSTLSGGELQRVVTASCLAKPADLYLLDEPSAFLDVEERVVLAKQIRRVISKRKKACFVVDHDLLFLSYISDRIILFEGVPGREGLAHPPVEPSEALNEFLKTVGITFRRDERTGRPRANKPGSKKDVEQRKAGKFFI